ALTTLATAMAFGTALAQDTTPPTTQPPPPQQPPTQSTKPPTQHPPPPTTHRREHGMKARPSKHHPQARHDERVTPGHLAEHPKLQEKFGDIDSGGDGTISRAEYDAWKARKKDKARDGNPSQP